MAPELIGHVNVDDVDTGRCVMRGVDSILDGFVKGSCRCIKRCDDWIARVELKQVRDSQSPQ